MPAEGIRAILKKIYHTPVIKKAVISVVSTVYPPPYQREFMEFEFDVWLGMTAIHCVNKRQLGENNTLPGFYRESIPTEYHKSKFEGSRAGYMMNMTALRVVMDQWESALALISAIRHCYMQRFNIFHKELGPADLYILAKICAALPAFLVRRSVNPVPDGEIPAEVAAEFKITAGIFMVLRKMMENGVCWSETNRTISAEALYDYADRHNVFISSSGNVCSGSKRKIIELADVMIRGGAGEKGLSEGFLRLGRLVSDIDAFLDYSLQALTLEVMIALCRAIAAKTFIDIGLNFLHDKTYKHFSENYIGILNRIDKILPAGMSLNCQIEVLHALLEKLGAGEIGSALKSRIAESDSEYMAGLAKKMSHLPSDCRAFFAKAVGRYLEILVFLGDRGGILQNQIFSVLARKKAAKLSMINVERRLGIVNRRELEKVGGLDMGEWYDEDFVKDLVQKT